MAATKSVTWLAYRRRRWLVAFLGAMGAILAWGLLSGGVPEVVLYNDSPRPLAAVRLGVGAVIIDFPPLAPGESVVSALPLRVGGELEVWLPGTPPRRVAGPWVEPRETAQVVARVDPFGQIIFSQLPSWQSRLVSALR